MKQRLLAKLFFVLFISFTACHDDDNAPSFQFTTTSSKYSLDRAKLYLTKENDYVTASGTSYTYRDYFITDGTLIEGEDGNTMSDYNSSTYLIGVSISTPKSKTLGSGEYPQYGKWFFVPEGSNMSIIYSEASDGTMFSTQDENEDTSPVVISGGINDGDEMTLKFNGKLTKFQYDAAGALVEGSAETAELFYTGKVIDKRP